MVKVRVELLASLPEHQWDDIRHQLARITLAPEQIAFGGNPAEFVDLEWEPERNVFLIYADETLVGVGSLLTGEISPQLWPLQTRAIQLRGFVIDKTMQGKGIGTKASRHLIQLAKKVDPGAEHLTLTVNQRNPAARRTYEKAGFAVLPEPYTDGPIGPQDIMYAELTR